MSVPKPLEAPQLSAIVHLALEEFLGAARKTLGSDLLAAVLYGSAAEGKLRSTSDVNLVLVLVSFDQNKIDLLRAPLRVAYAAIKLRPMFLLKPEVSQAACAFAPKFADILRRRVVLYGDDPFATVSIPRDIRVSELRQLLLNQILRLRASYVSQSLREEQLRLVVVRAIGPLRSSAATLLEIQGSPANSAQQALERIGSELGATKWTQNIALLSALQDSPLGFEGNSTALFFAVLDLATRMHARVEALSREAAS